MSVFPLTRGSQPLPVVHAMQRANPTTDPGRLDADQSAQLNDLGIVVLEGFMSTAFCARLGRRIARLHELEGERAGAEFKQEPGCLRLANLVAKGEEFAEVINCPTVLACVRKVLGPNLKLSSLNARTVLPGCPSQPLHADMGAVADAKGFWVCNTVWMLDDFTPDNGAIRFVPGSHGWGRLPQDSLIDLSAPHADEVLITGMAGTVVVMNAHLWHGGTANRTSTSRTAIHAFYCRSDKPQQQHQKTLLPADVQRGLSPELRALLALDDPLNDELAHSTIRRSGFLA